MKSEKLFIVESYELPSPLQESEELNLFKLMHNGDKNAKNKIIMHNIKLVLYRVLEKFKNYDYDKQELVSVGIIGLEKAVITFNIEKNIKFSTYASRCIDNEISNFLYKLEKFKKATNDDNLLNCFDNYEQYFENILIDDTDFESKIIENEIHGKIREIVKELPQREKEMITLYFGFNNTERLLQKDIARIFNLSQAQVCRLLSKSVRFIAQSLSDEGLIELNNSSKILKKQKK